MPRHNARARVITSIPFYDTRLTPTQNKFVEMWRNNLYASEIAEEMEVSVPYVSATISRLRYRFGDDMIPRHYTFSSKTRKPKRPLQYISHVHCYWVYLHRKLGLSLRVIARENGRKPGTVAGAIWRYEK